MNTARLHIVASRIEALPHGRGGAASGDTPGDAFNMAVWLDATPCGTTACIGGWTCREFGAPTRIDGRLETVPEAARRHLDLTADEAAALFTPPNRREVIHHRYYDGVTPAEAARATRRLADTGDRTPPAGGNEALAAAIWGPAEKKDG